ncbi:MAG: ATP-binding cassette domain-containing protein [Holosporaceae bacterium]
MSSLVKLSSLRFSYPESAHPLLQDVSLAIKANEAIALIGSNGSGKSTLLKILARQLAPAQGLKKLPPAQKVVMLSQDAHQDLFLDLTVAENLVLMGFSFDGPQAQKTFLDGCHPNLFQRLHQPIQKLSGGEKQAFLLGTSLYHKPSLLLMDEPTSAMDPKAQNMLMQQLHHKISHLQSTFVLCSHSLESVQRYTKRLIALKKGRIVLDRPSAMPLTASEFQQIYG